ncbi:hypothetical protein PG985_003127 [Apiospora marii]|uniref:Uncharacterized protein n=1 Tax=Apiospora marii TaxID=335849 RepID=A0ABR1RUP7_9PEZI
MASSQNLVSIAPSKGMLYGNSGHIADKRIDDAIFAALKAAYANHQSYAKLLEGNPAEMKSEVDTILGDMFKSATTEPILSTLLKDHDGLELLTKLQSQTTWAKDVEFTAFAVFVHSLIKAHQKWEEGAGVSFVLIKNDYSKTSVEIASFLKLIGANKWAGLDAEVELLKSTDA